MQREEAEEADRVDEQLCFKGCDENLALVIGRLTIELHSVAGIDAEVVRNACAELSEVHSMLRQIRATRKV